MGATAWTLQLNSVKPGQDGLYKALVSNPVGTVTSTEVRLAVWPRAIMNHVWQDSPNPTAPYTNWPTAAHTIQDAVDAALLGAVVLVTNGIYESGGRSVIANGVTNRVVIDRPVTVKSVNGPGVTTIKGYQMPGTTNGEAAIRCVYLASDAVLTGFTITNGACVHKPEAYSSNDGGGVYCQSTNALVLNCEIVGNSAGDGGGVCGGTVRNCILVSNTAHGGWVWSARWGYLSREGYGGGAIKSVLQNCTVIRNSGGVSYSYPVESYICAFYNCILYYNGAGNYSGWDSLNYCCTTPMPIGGSSNITNEPLFVSLSYNDFRLQPNSPCIDAGMNLPGLDTDMRGMPRVMDGNGDSVARVDLGAYEFNPYRLEPVVQMGADGFHFSIRGEPGRSVRIERSRDLARWEFVGQVTLPASGQAFVDPAALGESHLFYRAVPSAIKLRKVT